MRKKQGKAREKDRTFSKRGTLEQCNVWVGRVPR